MVLVDRVVRQKAKTDQKLVGCSVTEKDEPIINGTTIRMKLNDKHYIKTKKAMEEEVHSGTFVNSLVDY